MQVWKNYENIPVYKDNFVCPKWKSKIESFPINELKFKFNDNIQDKIKNNILPTHKINNKIEKVPVSSDFEDQLMMDDEL